MLPCCLLSPQETQCGFRAYHWGLNFVRPIGSTAEPCLSPFSRSAPGGLAAPQLSGVDGRWHQHPLGAAGCGSHAQWGTWLFPRLCLISNPESCLSWAFCKSGTHCWSWKTLSLPQFLSTFVSQIPKVRNRHSTVKSMKAMGSFGSDSLGTAGFPPGSLSDQRTPVTQPEAEQRSQPHPVPPQKARCGIELLPLRRPPVGPAPSFPPTPHSCSRSHSRSLLHPTSCPPHSISVCSSPHFPLPCVRSCHFICHLPFLFSIRKCYYSSFFNLAAPSFLYFHFLGFALDALGFT